mmetsp:Transcript_65525/g.152174  ORF Transcript_65525/g.152174 Transcript_65525/m.152174 type:complete len:233 (+) Transcript_65525:282-980(+)
MLHLVNLLLQVGKILNDAISALHVSSHHLGNGRVEIGVFLFLRLFGLVAVRSGSVHRSLRHQHLQLLQLSRPHDQLREKLEPLRDQALELIHLFKNALRLLREDLGDLLAKILWLELLPLLWPHVGSSEEDEGWSAPRHRAPAGKVILLDVQPLEHHRHSVTAEQHCQRVDKRSHEETEEASVLVHLEQHGNRSTCSHHILCERVARSEGHVQSSEFCSALLRQGCEKVQCF